MQIKKVKHQMRRDFWATYECEDCGYETSEKQGYDDRNFHDNVIPTMKCEQCGKSRLDIGVVHEPTQTKYEPWEVV